MKQERLDEYMRSLKSLLKAGMSGAIGQSNLNELMFAFCEAMLHDYELTKAKEDSEATFWRQGEESFDTWLKRLPMKPVHMLDEEKKRKDDEFFFFLFSGEGREILRLAIQLGHVEEKWQGMHETGFVSSIYDDSSQEQDHLIRRIQQLVTKAGERVPEI